jgi:FkbM family methyltransferase
MASVWLAKSYHFTYVIAVEPDRNNATLVRENLELNGITGQVLEAAIGPKDGTARFEFNELSNLGRLSAKGSLVPMITVDTIGEKAAVTRFALIKIDIEGGEQELFDRPGDWLTRTDAIIIEFHPTMVDYPRLTKFLSSNGFTYIPAHSVSPGNMDCFLRNK